MEAGSQLLRQFLHQFRASEDRELAGARPRDALKGISPPARRGNRMLVSKTAASGKAISRAVRRRRRTRVHLLTSGPNPALVRRTPVVVAPRPSAADPPGPLVLPGQAPAG